MSSSRLAMNLNSASYDNYRPYNSYDPYRVIRMMVSDRNGNMYTLEISEKDGERVDLHRLVSQINVRVEVPMGYNTPVTVKEEEIKPNKNLKLLL